MKNKLRVVAMVMILVLSFSLLGCSEMAKDSQEAYSISGVVVDQSGQSIANANLNYKTAQNSGVATTNQQGEWQINNLTGLTKIELEETAVSGVKEISGPKENLKFIRKNTSLKNSSLKLLAQSTVEKFLLEVNEDNLVFKNKGRYLDSLSQGQAVAIQDSDLVPNGLLREVISISEKNQRLIVHTTKLTSPLAEKYKQKEKLQTNNINITNTGSNLTVLSPQYAEVGKTTTISGSTAGKSIWSGGIYRIVFKVDGYTLGTAYPSSGDYSLNYQFTYAGNNRKLTAIAYDVWGREVVQVNKKINVVHNKPDKKLTVEAPSQIEVGKNAEFTGTAPRNVNKVVLSVDGYKIGETAVSNGNYNLNYSFYQAGQNRELVVNAFDKYGRSLKQISTRINVAAENNYSSGVKLNVPYYYQLNNTYEPYRTCNITSVAMALSYKTLNIDPDTIYRRFGPVFTGYDMQRIARYYGASNTTYHAGASVSQIKNYLDRGIPVIFQGQFTSSGHIIVLTGYDDTGWFVHDPYGEWYSWGYQHTQTAGKGEHYSYGLIERESLGAYHVTAVY